MSERGELFAKLFRLVSASREGGLSDAERQELDELVTGSDTARDLYLELIFDTLDLEFWSGQYAIDDTGQTSPASITNGDTHWTNLLFRPTPFSLAIAALFMGVLITAMSFMAAPVYRVLTRRNIHDAPRIVAELVAEHNAVWATGQIGTHRGAFLAAGRQLELTSGKVQIVFRDGAEVVVEGPLRMELLSENAARLNLGRMTALVPKRAQGFAVTTSTAEVVDLGTEFALEVDEQGKERLYVFDGLVRVKRNGSSSSRTSQEMRAGEGLAWSAEGSPTTFSRPPNRRFAAMAAELRPLATVLFYDNFNANDTDNFDGASLEGRRGGALAAEVVLRSAMAQQGIANNQLKMVCGPQSSGRVRFERTGTAEWYDWAAGLEGATIADAGGLRIDFNWTAADTATDNWISFNVGHGGMDRGEPAMRVSDRETDYGILLRGNGGTQRFDNGVPTTTTSFSSSNQWRQVTIELAFDSFADGTNVDVTVTVGGVEVDRHRFTWDNNFGQLYMELGALQSGMLIDNLRLISAEKQKASLPQQE